MRCANVVHPGSRVVQPNVANVRGPKMQKMRENECERQKGEDQVNESSENERPKKTIHGERNARHDESANEVSEVIRKKRKQVTNYA